MKRNSAARNVGLDMLRGLSMVYIVVFWHMISYVEPAPDIGSVITYRLTLVVIGTFVLLSGFLLGQRSHVKGMSDVLLFYKKRLVRIYPLYLIALMLFAVLQIDDLATLAKAAVFVSMLWAPAPHTLWFVAMLMLLYCVAPFLLLASEKLGTSRFIAICIGVFAALCAYSFAGDMLDHKLLFYFPAFAFGLLVGNRGVGLWANRFSIWGFVAVLAGAALSFARTPSGLVNEILYIPMIICGAYWLLLVAQHLSFRRSRLEWFFVALAYASYCMYLFHRPLYLGWKALWFPSSVAWQVIYLVCFGLTIIVAVSWAVQKGYDLAVDRLAARRVNARGRVD